MAVTHTAADATAATTMTNAVADIEQETPEIEKERQLAGVGAGAGTVANGKKKPHDHALASILGPAFVAAVAYVDPGNVAANITSGARYGYLLVWVLVLANDMSVLIQYQSAKLGIVTNKSLPELRGERMSDAGRFMFFMQAEVIAIATDLAEVIGGAIALNLLFGLPLFIGGLAALYPHMWLGMIVGTAAICYTVYLLYVGLPTFMNIPSDEGFLFSSSVLAVGLVVLVAIMAFTVIVWGLGVGPVYTN